ncbi:UNVERIFIED_CONTAM: hypothetical protein FKN15_070225 [Acipenser sinensis]
MEGEPSIAVGGTGSLSLAVGGTGSLSLAVGGTGSTTCTSTPAPPGDSCIGSPGGHLLLTSGELLGLEEPALKLPAFSLLPEEPAATPAIQAPPPRDACLAPPKDACLTPPKDATAAQGFHVWIAWSCLLLHIAWGCLLFHFAWGCLLLCFACGRRGTYFAWGCLQLCIAWRATSYRPGHLHRQCPTASAPTPRNRPPQPTGKDAQEGQRGSPTESPIIYTNAVAPPAGGVQQHSLGEPRGPGSDHGPPRGTSNPPGAAWSGSGAPSIAKRKPPVMGPQLLVLWHVILSETCQPHSCPGGTQPSPRTSAPSTEAAACTAVPGKRSPLPGLAPQNEKGNPSPFQ